VAIVKTRGVTPTANHAHEYDAQVIPIGQQTLLIKSIGDELQISEVEGASLGELDAE
jgi:hypothetical protein